MIQGGQHEEKKKVADLAICTMIRLPNITENVRNCGYNLLGFQQAGSDRQEASDGDMRKYFSLSAFQKKWKLTLLIT